MNYIFKPADPVSKRVLESDLQKKCLDLEVFWQRNKKGPI